MDQKEEYPDGTLMVEHGKSHHPDTLAFRNACGLCPPPSWDGVPELEDVNEE